MDRQYVRGSETLLKFEFLSYFLIIQKENHPKKSVLVVSKILGLFVNILTPNEKYSLSVKASV